MSWYNERGEKAPDAIKITDGESEGWKFNPWLSEKWRNENGYTIEKSDDYDHRRAEFDAACQQFRSVCQQIGAAIGDENFHGGFDEMEIFRQSAAFDMLQGMQLAVAWSGANDLCTYLGKKIGLGQPQWWNECWRGVEEAQTGNE